jgi:hypothetical protein
MSGIDDFGGRMNVRLTAFIVFAAVSADAGVFHLDRMGLAEVRRSAPAISVPAASPIASASSTPSSVKRFSITVSAECAGPLAVASWCPVPGPGVVGGPEREVAVKLGDIVEFVLTYDAARGRDIRTFFLCAPGADKPCEDLPLFGVAAALLPGQTTTIRFKANLAGRFKYQDTMIRGDYGILSVAP